MTALIVVINVSVNMSFGFADRPMGMQDGYPDFAIRRRELESRLVAFFHQSGYELVSSGAFEYVDTLLRARPSVVSRDWVQLFDGTGNTIALRPEMTPSIARMAAPLVASGKAPIRWSYAERVYRRTNDPASLSWASGKAAESTQVGIEWIGESGLETDATILSVCHQATIALGLTKIKIVVSHAQFVPALLQTLGVEEELTPTLLNCLTDGDYVQFSQLVPKDLPIDVFRVLQDLRPTKASAIEELVPKSCWRDSAAGQVMVQAFEHLCRVHQSITAQGPASDVVFDLTLHRDISYYTGIVFEVFAPGVGAPIAQGGRYDELLKAFGADAPAIGLAFEVERALAVLQQQQMNGARE